MVAVVLSSLLPGLFWLWYFNRYDQVEKEPLSKILLCVLAGVVAVLLALVWEAPFRGLLHRINTLGVQLGLSFVIVGLGEEFFKLLGVYLVIFRSRHLNEPMDGIIYTIAGSIGFAVLENILYISAFGLTVAPLRGTIATLAHIGFSGLAGYHLGLAKFAPRPWQELSKGLVIAALLHGLYDFLLITRLISPFSLIIYVLVIHYILLKRIRSAVEKSPLA